MSYSIISTSMILIIINRN